MIRATFVARPNRFLILASTGGETVEAACADPGRLLELLRPGVPLCLLPCDRAERRTRFSAVLAGQRGRWVSVWPALANRLFDAAVNGGLAAGLEGWRVAGREVRHAGSRFDFVLQRRGLQMLTEVKSVTLVENGRALFPDAPTLRGARHVRELSEHCRGGGRATLAFVVQRSDARSVSPHAGIDPALAEALVEARRAGVRLLGYGCRVTPRGARIERRIPVVLS